MPTLNRVNIGILFVFIMVGTGTTTVSADLIILDTWCIGGSGNDRSDEGDAVQQTMDGGYIVTGFTASSDGDFTGTGYHRNGDAFLIKVNNIGIVEWAREIGGSGADHGTSVEQTADEGFIIAGYTTSTDGNFSDSGYNGWNDAFIAKVNHVGTIEWVRCVGGSGFDIGTSALQTTDGGYILAGHTSSSDGSFINAGNHGGSDAFLAKFDATGTVEWTRCIGGSNDNEYGHAVQQNTDGGFILGGQATSWDGDFTGSGYHHYTSPDVNTGDAFLAKVDATGTVEWTRCFGGSLNDHVNDFQMLDDGWFIIAGSTTSSDGDFTGAGYHAEWDTYMAKVNTNGSVGWARCIGGSGNEQGLSSTKISDNNYILTGMTDSSNGDLTGIGYHGSQDAFLAKVSEAGVVGWVRCIGGSGADSGHSIRQTTDNGVILAGYTSSSDSDLEGAGLHGSVDVFLAKFINPMPAIDIEKYVSVDDGTTWEDADTQAGPHIQVGTTVQWQYTVTNTGNVPLIGITVTDDQGIMVSLPKTMLGPGESMVTTDSGTAIAGQYTNIGKATGLYEGEPVSDTDAANYFGEEDSTVPIPEFPTIVVPLGLIMGMMAMIFSIQKERGERESVPFK